MRNIRKLALSVALAAAALAATAASASATVTITNPGAVTGGSAAAVLTGAGIGTTCASSTTGSVTITGVVQITALSFSACSGACTVDSVVFSANVTGNVITTSASATAATWTIHLTDAGNITGTLTCGFFAPICIYRPNPAAVDLTARDATAPAATTITAKAVVLSKQAGSSALCPANSTWTAVYALNRQMGISEP